MHFPLVSIIFALPTLGSVLHRPTQDFLHDFTNEITPAWKREDGLTIVPLHSNARTGKIPPAVEEGLIVGAGNRFANVLLANISSSGELGSCWGCISTVVKETPCVYRAIKDKNPVELLSCGVGKTDVCNCAECLPAPIEAYVEAFCGSSVGDAVLATEKYSYVDFGYVAQYDPYVQGYRGDLIKYKAEQIGRSGGWVNSDESTDVSAQGNCDCAHTCLGLCIAGHCQGICA